MHDTDYEMLDGLALADLLKKGQAAPAELMACALSLAAGRNPAINALCHQQSEETLAIARRWELRGPFGGIPFLLKDSGLAHVRFPSSLGSRLFRDTTYPQSATLALRMEAAGLIPFARTCVPELCIGPTTEARHNDGPTRNPRDPSLSAGGSSGGSAAAVACGIVPMAHGSDGGGSIRIPAACCGVFGLKASRGRIPMGPFRGEGWAGQASDGVLSRTVRDTAAALDATAGYEPGSPYAAPPGSGYLDVVRRGPERPLRIAVWRRGWTGEPIADACLAAVEDTAGLCRGLGHEVFDADIPDLDYDAFGQATACVQSGNIVLAVENRLKALGRTLKDDDLEPLLHSGYEFGRRVSASMYIDSVNLFHRLGRLMAGAMEGCDLVLTPTLPQLPCKIGEMDMRTDDYAGFRKRVSRYCEFTSLFNATGQPAASLPLHWLPSGLPVATQLIAHFGREDLILALSAQLEAARPWSRRIARPAASPMAGGAA